MQSSQQQGTLARGLITPVVNKCHSQLAEQLLVVNLDQSVAFASPQLRPMQRTPPIILVTCCRLTIGLTAIRVAETATRAVQRTMTRGLFLFLPTFCASAATLRSLTAPDNLL